MKIRVLAWFVAAGVVALAMATAAEAKGTRAPALITGWTDAGDGLRVYAQGDTEFGGVSLWVERSPGRGFEGVGYAPQRYGDVSGHHMRSGLGKRGSIGMRFHRRRPVEVTRIRCLRLKESRGVLAGHFRFRGERRYVDVKESRMRAQRWRVDDSRCGPRGLRGRMRADGTRLPATLTACGRGELAYQVQRRRKGAARIVVFGRGYRSRGLYSSAFISKQIPFSAFTYANDFSSATIAPPPPFAGTGLYSSADGGTIEGDLRWRSLDGRITSLTHVPDVRLAGGDRRSCAGFISFSKLARAGDSAPRALLRSALQRRLRALP